MIRSHVVVDGSNIATEGRTTPSLKQLDDAVTAFLAEHDVETLTVVVDATFPNRIDSSERAEYEEALLAGELVTPPAGAIGRGDAFILQIAEKVGATVLSNDSFQELHAVHPWVFDEGRLIGGKPVPGVGWVFLLRSPVRGPVSRKATQGAKSSRPARGRSSEKAKPKEKEKEKVAAGADADGGRRRRGGRKRSGDGDGGSGNGSSGEGSGSRTRSKSKPAEAANEPLPFIEFVGEHPVGSVVEAEVETFSSHGAYVRVGAARCYVPLKLMGDPAPRAARDVLTVGETRRFAVHSLDTPRRGIDLALVAAPGDESLSEARPDASDAQNARKRKGSSSSRRSVSHDTDDGTAAGTPSGGSTSEAVVATTTRSDQHAEEAPVSPAAKKAAAKKTAAKKTTARKAVVKKAPAKKTAAKKAPAKKTAAKKAPAKKTAAKKAPAKKTAAKKAPAKKTAAKKAPAKKTAAKKAPAKKTAAKKAPAKKTAAKKAPAKKTAAKKSTARR